MRFIGKDIVWDRKNNKVLCQFIDGELETEDERTIKILTKLGYKSTEKVEDDKETAKNEDITLEELSYKELQKMAKKKGIKATGVKREDLVMALEV